jgi:hypothetical protein
MSLHVFSSSRFLSFPTALPRPLTPSLHPQSTMLPTSFLSLALLATAVVAAPSSNSRLSKRIARRRGGLPNKIDGPEGSESTNVEYSSNWAGAVLIADTVSYLYSKICPRVLNDFLGLGDLYSRDGHFHGPYSLFTRRWLWILCRLRLGRD